VSFIVFHIWFELHLFFLQRTDNSLSQDSIFSSCRFIYSISPHISKSPV
jgi:hypothetical protein